MFGTFELGDFKGLNIVDLRASPAPVGIGEFNIF
jgi:hypothetical protein